MEQHLSIPVYTIFKNLTIILIVRLVFLPIFMVSSSFIGIWRGYLVWRESDRINLRLFHFHGGSILYHLSKVKLTSESGGIIHYSSVVRRF